MYIKGGNDFMLQKYSHFHMKNRAIRKINIKMLQTYSPIKYFKVSFDLLDDIFRTQQLNFI